MHLAEEEVLPIGRPADQLPGVVRAEQIPVRVQEPDGQRVREHAACPHHVEGRLLQRAIGEEHADRDRGFCLQLGDGLLLPIAVQLRIDLLWRGVGFALDDQPGGALAFAAAQGHIDAWPAWQQRHAGLCPCAVQPLHGQRAQVDLQQRRAQRAAVGIAGARAQAGCSTWRSRSTVGQGRARPTHR